MSVTDVTFKTPARNARRARRAREPLVSVLLPVHDAGEVLREAVESVLAQTLEELEVVAVDDGSTDASPAILAELAASDPRVRVRRRPHGGIVAALETARALARGRYLARMDADDLAHPRRLEAQVALLEEDPRVALCGTLVAYFPEEAVRDGGRRYEAWVNGLRSHEEMVRDLFVECPVPHPTFLLPAAVLEAVGGYRDRGWPEDYDLVLRIWAAGGRLAKVEEVLLWWREGPDRLSRTAPAYSEAAFRRCKVHHLRRTLLRGRPLVVWGAGPVGKAFAREFLRQGGRLRAFVDLDPRKVGQEIHGAPVVTPGEVEDLRRAFFVAAVGQPGAREEIREALRAAGLEEGEDFVAVA